MNSDSDSEKEFSVMLRSKSGKRTVDSGSDYEGIYLSTYHKSDTYIV